jgi:hypothetical protein
MSFDESEVNRSENGTFASKVGTPTDVVLQPETSDAKAVNEFRETLNQVARGSKRDWNLRDEVLRDRAMGRASHYEEEYSDIWSGRAEGWSEEEVRRRLATVNQLQDDISEERISPSAFSARNQADWTRDGIAGWLDVTEAELRRALDTEGRSLIINARKVRPQDAS